MEQKLNQMTNLGAFPLKKLNSKLFYIFIGFICALFFSCKTVSVQNQSQVNPLDLLDNKSAFYLALPASQDKNLVQKMILNNVSGITEKNAKEIAERTQMVYVGLNKSRKSTEVQLSANVNIPKFAISNIFTKKYGWQTLKIASESDNKKEYSVFEREDCTISFPNEKIAVLGRDVPFMIQKYDELSFDGQLDNSDFESFALNPSCYEWLNENNGEVRFYALKPQSFLRTLMGANLNFKLSYVKGSMVSDPKNDEQYLMNLEFEFKNSSLVLPAKSVLSLAFGLTNSEIYQTSQTQLQIKNIKISKNQLYKLLVI